MNMEYLKNSASFTLLENVPWFDILLHTFFALSSSKGAMAKIQRASLLKSFPLRLCVSAIKYDYF
jgi:hypothetical protein